MFLKANPIYKINYLTNENKLQKIVVFFGENQENIDPEELFKKEPTNPFFIDKNTGKSIFNEKELKNILDNKIPVTFSEQQIHYDDNIGIIKLKIINEFSNTFSLDEIYLFCLQKEILYSEKTYQSLTQGDRLPLTRTRLDQFITNIIYDEKGDPVILDIPDKEIYDYDDIVSLDISNKEYILTKPLGQKFFIIVNEYPFVVNPFEVIEYDDFIERASRNSLTTLNSNLLFNTGEIYENNIFLTLAKDVFNENSIKNISQLYTSKIYFPLLNKKGIHSLKQLEEKRFSLIEDNKKIVTESTFANFQTVDLFYDLYKERKKDLKYIKTGVRSIKISIIPLYKFKIPLDTIFKIIHATDSNPIIKLNPSSRQENIYRLATDKISTDGRKIPILEKTEIFKLMRSIGKTKSLSSLIRYKDKYDIVFEIFDDVLILR